MNTEVKKVKIIVTALTENTQEVSEAIFNCKSIDYDVLDHFAVPRKMVDIGSNTKRKIIDYKLTLLFKQ